MVNQEVIEFDSLRVQNKHYLECVSCGQIEEVSKQAQQKWAREHSRNKHNAIKFKIN